MINKTDIVLLLSDLFSDEEVRNDINLLYKTEGIPLELIKKINDKRPLDLANFYEKLRASYNSKKSKLYINIMKANENTRLDPGTILTTLTALLNQIFQFKCDDKSMFYSHSRAGEITKVLNIFLENDNFEPAYKLLSLIKADIITLEYIAGRRDV